MTVSHTFTGNSKTTVLPHGGQKSWAGQSDGHIKWNKGRHWSNCEMLQRCECHPQALCVSVVYTPTHYHVHFSLIPLRWNFKLHNIGTWLYTTRLRETSEKKNSQNPIRDQVSERTTSYFLNHYTVVVVLLNKERMYLHCRRPGFDLWVGKIPWRREWLPTPGFLPEEFHGQRRLAGYSPWGCRESDTTEGLTLVHIFLELIF